MCVCGRGRVFGHVCDLCTEIILIHANRELNMCVCVCVCVWQLR